MRPKSTTNPHKIRFKFLRRYMDNGSDGEIVGANVRCFYSGRTENGTTTNKFLNYTYRYIDMSFLTPAETNIKSGLYRVDNTIPDAIPVCIDEHFILSKNENYARRSIRRAIFTDPVFENRVFSKWNIFNILECDIDLYINTVPQSQRLNIFKYFTVSGRPE